MAKILIIEDDADIAAIERDYLEVNGYQVEIAADGEAGLAQGLRGGHDLILLDLMLPVLDGFTVCRKLRENIDTPILMVTARREDIDKIRGAGLGGGRLHRKTILSQRIGGPRQGASGPL